VPRTYRDDALVSRNVASVVTLPAARKATRRRQTWDAEEARRFLESAYADRDPLYPLWVLILVLGLRKGEAQGLIWSAIDLDTAQVSLEWQVQRVGRQLIHKHQLKSDGSTDVLPLPGIFLSALKTQDRMRVRLTEEGGTWPDDGLCSPLVPATRSSRERSTAASMPAALRPGSAASEFTTPRYLTWPLRMRSGGSAMPWAMPVPNCPTMTSRPPLLYAAAVNVVQMFGNPVELRGLEPLTFWLQTRRSSS
jgi:hypothetical protein